MIKCPACDTENPSSYSFCAKCATKLINPPNINKTTYSTGSTVIPDDNGFCIKCGDNRNRKESMVPWIILGFCYPAIGLILSYALKRRAPEIALACSKGVVIWVILVVGVIILGMLVMGAIEFLR